MIFSMTGYGEAEKEIPEGRLRVTIKTVNHRFLNTHLRTPAGFDRYEADIQQWLKRHFSRGHINLTLTLERGTDSAEGPLPRLDLARARHYKELLATLQKELGLEGPLQLSWLLRFGDIFPADEKGRPELDVEPALLHEVVDEAATGALLMRRREGAVLAEDMADRLQAMRIGLAIVEERAPRRLVAERDRIRAAILELSELDDVDEERLAKEVAYLAERWDVNEEMVRLGAHLEAFQEILEDETGDPAGKRLGFLVQEMHREANTIGSKANDLEISRASMAIREEIERLREQVENVE